MFSKSFKLIQLIFGFFYFRSTIKSGVFKGFLISKNFFGSSYLPKILGTYECEIAKVFFNSIEECELFIDIGCAGGYYIQLATQINPNIEIIGIDINEDSLNAIKKNIKYNRLELKNLKFDESSFDILEKSSSGKKTLVLIDVEGYEWPVIDNILAIKDKNPNINFIIELHNHDPRSYKLPKNIIDKYSILNYRFYSGIPFLKLITENEFRDLNTQYLIL